jgi:hypothetical protein
MRHHDVCEQCPFCYEFEGKELWVDDKLEGAWEWDERIGMFVSKDGAVWNGESKGVSTAYDFVCDYEFEHMMATGRRHLRSDLQGQACVTTEKSVSSVQDTNVLSP